MTPLPGIPGIPGNPGIPGIPRMSSKNHSCEHHFGATLPHFRSNPAKKHKKTQSVVKSTDFYIKSAKTLEVLHFLLLFADKCDTPSVFNDFHLKSAKTLDVLHFFMLLARKV